LAFSVSALGGLGGFGLGLFLLLAAFRLLSIGVKMSSGTSNTPIELK
jgi:hypothetical protein